jgi:3-oxoacyl-[acyl-carrier-protein] synthase II
MSATGRTARRVAVSGLGICAPLGGNIADFAAALLGGLSSLAPVGNFDVSGLTSRLASTFPADTDYGIPPSLGKVVDKAALSAYAALREALADSGLEYRGLDHRRIAVVVGSSHAGIDSTEKIYLQTSKEKARALDPREVFSILTSSVGNVICSHVGARGPRLTVSSACASSTTAMGVAFDLVAADDVDCAIVAGTDTVSLPIMAGFSALKALSPEFNAPFSAPSGLNLGEGAAVFIVEPREAIVKRGCDPRMEILGYGLSSDAYHITAPDLSGEGARRAIVEALRDAGVPAEQIDYVSAHGTGTDANDKPESIATAAVFGTEVPLSSPKSCIGHTLGASGMIETLITLLYARKGLIPPTHHHKGTREGCLDLNYVPNYPQERRVATFCCNNFGFGGNNSSVIIGLGDREPKPRVLPRHRVALVGGGTVTPNGSETADFTRAYREGKSALVVHPSGGFRVGRVPPFRFTQPELLHFARSAPMIKFGLKAAANALESHRDFFRDNLRCGIVGGMLNGSSTSIEKYFDTVFVDGAGLASAQQFPMTTVNACAGQIAIAFGIKGYNTTFCGGGNGLFYARDLIRRGRQDAVLAVAADDLTERVLDIYRGIGLIAPWAEGSTALVLERLDSALDRGAPVLCEIAGMALGQDARLFGPGRTGSGLADVAGKALSEAGAKADEIDVVVATDCAVNRIGTNIRAAVRTLFPEAMKTVSSTGLAGFSPASTTLLNIHMASLLLDGEIEEAETPRLILVLDTDITGINTATVLKKYRRDE